MSTGAFDPEREIGSMKIAKQEKPAAMNDALHHQAGGFHR
jgi:hypothetical protein